MKVSELIEILSEMDPDANVLLVTQQNWPFENSVKGVCQREDVQDMDETEDEPNTLPANDVFLVEGEQLRYGNKMAWDAARRY